MFFANQNAVSAVGSAANEEAVKSLVIQNHPVFSQLGSLLNSTYRIFFTNKSEMIAWLKAARGGKVDGRPPYHDSHEDYIIRLGKTEHVLSAAKTLFNEHGQLIPMLSSDWKPDMLDLTSQPISTVDDL